MAITVDNFYKTASEWTEELVRIPSVNGTSGERKIMEKVKEILYSFEYFKTNPDFIWEKEIEGDSLGRKSVFGLVKGGKSSSNKTVLLHCHLDTVTTDDYGPLKEDATNPEVLMGKFKELELSPEVKEDLMSGDWYFGRGALDMKSGIASHLCVLEYLSNNRETFSGNVLFMANPIEETTHGGIIDALSELERLKEEEGFSYVTAINADFVGPLFPGDLTRYIYLGAVGKLLPAFYIRGKETHVGQPFEGLDPNLIASKLVSKINMNMALADEAEGESTLPPSALKVEDLKTTYNVQTPIASFVYFNYFVHQISPSAVIEQLKSIATDAFHEVVDYLNEQYRKHGEVIGTNVETLPWKAKVLTYDELYQKVKNKNGEFVDNRLIEIINENVEDTDARVVGRLMVQELLKMDNDSSPIIVLFFGPPFVPRNFVKNQTKNEKNVIGQLNALLKEMGEELQESFVVKKFFPSLTDSSYLSMDDSKKDISNLKDNFPGMDRLYPVDVEKIKKLNIPAINIGTWGKDAHKMAERVYKPYTFQTLPKLTLEFTTRLLKKIETD